jgi:hypothetical protein
MQNGIMAFKHFQRSAAYEQSSDSLPAPIRGRLTAEQTAHVLGFEAHDIPILVREGHLVPLGDPVDNAKKYFAWVEVMACAGDAKWLHEATRAVYQHWKDKNANRTKDESALTSAQKN